MMPIYLRHSPMIGIAFDGGFQHVEEAKHVILVHMSLIPQAEANELAVDDVVSGAGTIESRVPRICNPQQFRRSRPQTLDRDAWRAPLVNKSATDWRESPPVKGRARITPRQFSCTRVYFSYTNIQMQIVWDEVKRQTNLAKHGLDFAELDPEFFAGAIFSPSVEGCSLAVGIFKGRLVVAVVFRPLGSEAISVISMRPASRKERKRL